MPRNFRRIAGITALTSLFCGTALAQDGSLSVIAKPVRSGAPEVQYITVDERIGLTAGSTALDLCIPIVYAGRKGIADRVQDLAVRDAAGAVPMRMEDDTANPGGFPFYRHWRAERAVSGPVTVTYRMMSFTGTVTPGPQFDFYSHDGGVSTGGMALFVLPQNMPDAALAVHWDLRDLPKGAVVASTYGAGDIALRGSPERLAQAYYEAGPLGHYEPSPDSVFRAYWLGKPAFDPTKEMVWAAKAYTAMRGFWRSPADTGYTAFIRAIPNTGGGTGIENSFMAGVAPGNENPGKPGPRMVLFHEMGHRFVGQLAGGPGDVPLVGGTWFAEGLNVHYTRLLMLRFDLWPVDDYVEDVDHSVSAFYSNPYRLASAEELSRIGFSAGVGGASAQNVAYTRGSLFFADLDARIRAASVGKRTLDDVILPFLARRQAGEAVTQKDLVDAFVAEIGPQARERFEAVIVRGENVDPAPDAFGPCLERKPKVYDAGGQAVNGYEWVRKPGLPDAQCRAW
ncbi:putative lipoprotein [Nitrospirillum viridazoti Y2]|uniref:Uncharacterized protein n=1 Tax=Nitrospirillum amazonense TaxID=28077 RepID=A0A560HXI9_9PROT|nr:hypothetical protein [Nitrospirillum amazonense]EGX99480.1 putative lipoprotein [Nitrospirillum amazonense Y2]TWB50661.1 hypothetical protein FBZ92_12381 [Nitrospirillum amazonense]